MLRNKSILRYRLNTTFSGHIPGKFINLRDARKLQLIQKGNLAHFD
jgi:hypothetical protein